MLLKYTESTDVNKQNQKQIFDDPLKIQKSQSNSEEQNENILEIHKQNKQNKLGQILTLTMSIDIRLNI